MIHNRTSKQSVYMKRGEKAWLSQSLLRGNIVNYGNLVAVYIEDDLDDDENVLGYNLTGLTGTTKDADAIILGSFSEAEPAL